MIIRLVFVYNKFMARRWRRRKKYNSSANEVFLIFIFLFAGGAAVPFLATNLQIPKLPVGLLIAAGIGLLIIGITTIIYLQKFLRRKYLLNTTLAQLDAMDGHDFESYVSELMRELGFSTTVTKASGDFGVGIIADKDGYSYAVQTKRYTGSVGIEAVYQVVAGMKYYKCQRSMVVTTSSFTPAAWEMAKVHYCKLIDRKRLAEWVEEVQRKVRE